MSAETNQLLTTEEIDETRPRRIIDDEMDLTPMVDVTFLLLIFFMVTAAFAIQKAINVPPVNDQASAAQTIDDMEQDSYVIRIDADNVYWIGLPGAAEEQRALSSAEMRTLLRDARTSQKTGSPAKLLVKAHGDSRHESVVAALDAGAGVGIEEIRLLSYEEEDLDL